VKILFIQPFRYGDILQVQPVVKSVREKFTGCEVHFLADDYFAEILCNSSFIDRVIKFPKMKALADMKYRKDFKPAREAMSAFVEELKKEEYDHVINYNFTKSASLIAGIAKGASKMGRLNDVEGRQEICGEWSKYLLFFTAARRHNPYNIVDMFYMAAEEELGIGPGGLKRHPVFFETTADDTAKADEFIKARDINGRRMAGIQVGASKSHRMLLNMKYHELVIRLSDAGYDVVLFGGGGESAAAAEIIKASGASRVFNSCGSFTIRQNYAMLSKLKIFVTADTLNMHLAAAAGTPLLSVFYGEAYPYETGPYAPGAYVAMPAAVCAPCSNADGCSDRACLDAVKMDDLYAYAVKIMNMEEIKMNSSSGLNLYRTDVDISSGYRLMLCAGKESPEELVDRIYKELYAGFWGEIFAHNIDTFSSKVEEIWENHGAEIENCGDKASVISMFKARVTEHMKINTAAHEAMDCLDRLIRAKTQAEKRVILEKLAGYERFFMKEMEKGEIMGSYFKVELGTAEADPVKTKKIFSNIKLAANGFTFAIAYFMQKIHEHSLMNSEEMIIV
jgi:heptosyltransferase-3